MLQMSKHSTHSKVSSIHPIVISYRGDQHISLDFLNVVMYKRRIILGYFLQKKIMFLYVNLMII